jgi:hypothetical protein
MTGVPSLDPVLTAPMRASGGVAHAPLRAVLVTSGRKPPASDRLRTAAGVESMREPWTAAHHQATDCGRVVERATRI